MSENICYNFEGAMNLIIEKERECFQILVKGAKEIKNHQASELFKELSIKDLDHLHALEKALYTGGAESFGLDRKVQTMQIEDYLVEPALRKDLTLQDSMIVAMKAKKRCVEVYEKMLVVCAGSPMQEIFEKMKNEDSRDLQRLEDVYEKHFLHDM
jgi:hypothetical protein